MLTFLALLGLLALQVTAHMQLNYPAPFNASNNPHRLTAPDPYLQFPYNCCGPLARWPYPCRGYLDLLHTIEGAPTATWEAGSTQVWNISGIGNHYGGSCQVGFSIDGGKAFRVATSYEGNCPHRDAGDGVNGGQDFDFTVPGDLEVGVQVFAWTWYNREEEFNMNCAAVNITAPASSTPSSSTGGYGTAQSSTTSPTAAAASFTAVPTTYETTNGCTCLCASPVNIATCTCSCPPSANKERSVSAHALLDHQKRQTPSSSPVAFANRPLMLMADVDNGCLTPKTTAEVKYPQPGPDVVTGDGAYPLELPSGTCGGY